MKRLILMAAVAFGLTACGGAGEGEMGDKIELEVMDDGSIVSTI